jgi:hypothetical protein
MTYWYQICSSYILRNTKNSKMISRSIKGSKLGHF